MASNLRDPLLLALLSVLAAWALLGFVIRDPIGRSVGAALAGVFPLVSGYAFGWLRGLAFDPAARGFLELALLAVVVAIGVAVAMRVNWSSDTARFLNVFSAILLIFAVPSASRVFVPTGDAQFSEEQADALGPRPDIYLVVLDAYTGSESLDDIYGFDNGAVHDSLRKRGFSFPERPRSNYTTTFLSVGSMLNRKYLNDAANLTAPDFTDRTSLYHSLEFNRTVDDLKTLGYEFVYVGSSYPPMASNRRADVEFSRVRSREFERLWMRMTVLPAVLTAVCPLTARCRSSALHFGPETAAATDERMAFLRASIGRPGPKFVYAHWLLPHGPFRFDANCGHVTPGWTTGSMRIREDSIVRRRFLDQVRCANRRILEFVDAIRETSADSAVIILQADHGNGRFPGGRPAALDEAGPGQIRERLDVFAAYAGPYGIGDSIVAHRTPVNVFRTLFRVLWGYDEPPLAERSFWSGRDQPLRLIAVPMDGS